MRVIDPLKFDSKLKANWIRYLFRKKIRAFMKRRLSDGCKHTVVRSG